MVLNRFGFSINGGNAHYSFTLGMTYDKPIEQVKFKSIFKIIKNLKYIII